MRAGANGNERWSVAFVLQDYVNTKSHSKADAFNVICTQLNLALRRAPYLTKITVNGHTADANLNVHSSEKAER